MTDFRKVTDTFTTSPQIEIADLAEVARQGFKLVINNRPDGEAPGQPTSAEMEAAAKALGLAYRYVPVRGGPTPEQVDEVSAAVAEADGPVFAFCRSGTRSIVTWSIGQVLSGEASRDDLIDAGGKAGYDLSGVLPN
jgi:uncharacterized protein (TIGR01244 family)